MNNVNVGNQSKFKTYKGLKIAIAIVFLLACAFYVIQYIELFNSYSSENFGLSLAVFLTVIVIIIAPMVYAPTIILSVIGLISAIINLNKKRCSKGSLIYFIVFTLLPFVLYFAMIFTTKLLV